jgi:glycerol uptake facilitator-like aquaporin
MPLTRRVVAEAVGTALLLTTIVGSGIMAERLSGGNEALALLCNSTATGAILVVLIAVFGQVSGAHLNPAVTLAFAVRREISAALAIGYVLAQVTGAVLGTWAAHVMFDENVLQISTKARAGSGLWFAEALATFGLILTIFGTQRWKADMVPVTGWALHSVGLLVHGVHELRQPCRHLGTKHHQYLRRNTTFARACLHSHAGLGSTGRHSVLLVHICSGA